MPWPFVINELVTFSFPIFSDVIFFSHYVKSEENDKKRSDICETMQATTT